MRTVRNWTRKEEQRLADLRRSHSVRECAELLGRTYDSAHSRLRQLGLTGPWPGLRPKRRPGELLAAVKRMCGRCGSDAEIADLLWVRKEAVRQARRRLGIPPLRKPGGGPHVGVKRKPIPHPDGAR